MTWSALRETLDQKPTPRRDRLIIRAFHDGKYLPIKWAAVSVEIGSYLGILYVASDAMQLGVVGDSCRVNVTHYSAQRIVDCLGLAMLTDKVADLIHAQASVVIPPKTDWPNMRDGRGGFLSTMEKHSSRVQQSINDRSGLTSTVGKHWITHNKLLRKPQWGVNYGWHDENGESRSPGGHRLIQPASTHHSWSHVDYSQILVPMNRIMLVNGEEMLVEDVMQHPDLWRLVSYDGPLEVSRHPDVQPPEGGVGILRI